MNFFKRLKNLWKWSEFEIPKSQYEEFTEQFIKANKSAIDNFKLEKNLGLAQIIKRNRDEVGNFIKEK